MKTLLVTLALALPGFIISGAAKSIPAELPDPDGKPGDSSKPVKVYILAGQSNMVGMGNLSGATNIYDGVYLASDPKIPSGPRAIYKVGDFKISPLEVFSQKGEKTDKAIATGHFQVPLKGVYRFQCGFEGTSFNTMQVEGKEVYRREKGGHPVKPKIPLEAGKRYTFQINHPGGSPPRFWLEKTDLLGNGDLDSVAKREGKFPWLVDEQGEWTVRQDVYFQEARIAEEGKGSPLSPTSNNGKTIGPELGFGHVLGEFHNEQVLLIKTAMGNRALGFDFRPPSSGRNDPENKFEALEYKLMIEGVRKTLANIDQIVPGYDGQGYEMAGFVWFQGHKDSFTEELIAEYEENLVNLVKDVRAEFKVPKMPVVIGSNGFGGYEMAEKFLRIHAAQMAVGDPKKHPDFAGTVASVETRHFWREIDESPKSEDYHYNRNAETYLLIGDALGRAMVALKGGKAEQLLPLPVRRQYMKSEFSEPPGPTDEEIAADKVALRPIILDGIVPSYLADPRYQKAIIDEASGTPPQRVNQFLRGAMYGLGNCYEAAGIEDYAWRVFGNDLRDQEWDYLSFDPQEKPAKETGARYRKVSFPAGMENWFASDFDPSKVGWKTGLPPFGQLGGELEPLRSCDRHSGCGCGEKPRTLWDKEVLLMRGTFDIPPIKDGHRYRVVVGGSNHVTTGEGYAIYLDGKLLAESKTGVPNRQGGQPRGGHIYSKALDHLNDGQVTIAVQSFLQTHKRGKAIPHAGHLTVWIEEQKIPPVLSR